MSRLLSARYSRLNVCPLIKQPNKQTANWSRSVVHRAICHSSSHQSPTKSIIRPTNQCAYLSSSHGDIHRRCFANVPSSENQPTSSPSNHAIDSQNVSSSTHTQNNNEHCHLQDISGKQSSSDQPVDPQHNAAANQLLSSISSANQMDAPSSHESREQSTDQPTDPSISPFARPLRTAISHYPVELCLSLAACEMVSFFSTGTVLNIVGVSFSPLLVAAYFLSIPVRKSFIPKFLVGLPIGMGFGAVFPFLRQVRLSELFQHPKVKSISQSIKQYIAQSRFSWLVASRNKSNNQSQSQSFNGKWYHPSSWPSLLARAADIHGASLVIGYRLASAVIILTIYQAIKYGLSIAQIDWLIQSFGFDQSLSQSITQSSKSADYIGAVVCSAFLFPLVLLASPFPARAMYLLRKRIFLTKSMSTNKHIK